MLEVDWLQVAHLFLREIDSYSMVNALDVADRYRDLSFPPQVTLVQQDMRHVAICRIDDESLDSANRPVLSFDLVAAAQFCLTGRNTVEGPLASSLASAGHQGGDATGCHQIVVDQCACLILVVFEVLGGCGQELSVLCRKESVELGLTASELDLVPCRGHELNWYQTTRPVIVSWPDGEVSDRVRHGINHHTHDLPAVAIAAHDSASNLETRTVAHPITFLSGLSSLEHWQLAPRHDPIAAALAAV
jgi:hypothetical protein